MATDAKKHLQHEVLVGGVSNTIFNGLIAWLLLKSGPGLGWGDFSGDIIATALILPFIVALIVIPLQRGKMNKGKLDPITLGAGSFMQALADRDWLARGRTGQRAQHHGDDQYSSHQACPQAFEYGVVNRGYFLHAHQIETQ
jgi:hypothetical protein